MTNLSNYKLTYAETSVLNKGLGFVPAHFKPKFDIINNDLLRFERKLQIHYHFNKNLDYTNGENIGESNYLAFETNPDWWPRKLNGHITELCFKIRHSIYNLINKHHTINNLSRDEILALKTLKTNNNIIIKRADKGGAISVLDKQWYLSKINSMLADRNVYLPVTNDDTDEVKLKADLLIASLKDTGYLNHKQIKYLTNFKAKCPTFYGLPKLHKKDIPMRPICSQIDGPTSRINELVDKLLSVAENNIPYLLKDTTAYLLLLDKFKHVRPNTILLTMDVSSLYTNIPILEGTDWVCDYYQETLPLWNLTNSNCIPVDKNTLHKLIIFILENCTFDFNENKFKQLFGTTMGARFSVKFANIYMYQWLRKFVGVYTGCKPEFLARLIDDIFTLWDHGVEALNDFITYLNNCHPSIKFEATYSQESVNFLDTVTYIKNCCIHTTVFTKPTDKKQYLYFSSSHPAHTTKAIPYSQALRYRRIIDDNNILPAELAKLNNYFAARGYPQSLLKQTTDKISNISRESVLNYKDKSLKRAAFQKFLKGKSFLPLIIPYHQAFEKKLKPCIEKHWTYMLKQSENLSNTFTNEFPQLVYKRGVTIGNLLTSSKFTNILTQQDLDLIQTLKDLQNLASVPIVTKTRPCLHKNCKCCLHINSTSVYHNTDKSSSYLILDDFNCNSTNVIYVISCAKCNLLYVGQTARMLKERMNNHRSDILLHKSTAVAIHFNLPAHTYSDLIITPVLDITDFDVSERLTIEREFMSRLGSIYPEGMNFYPITE